MVKPEDVGLSAKRLDRIRVYFEPYINAGKVAGTLTLVARRGHVAYFEPQGYLELEHTRPMQRDTIFRIYSMSKPITSVALMMLYEQGLVQLDDPVYQFIPAWGDLQVFVRGHYPTFVTAPSERAMTIQLMTMNHLPGGQDLTHLDQSGQFTETAFSGVGFGLGFAVLLDPTRTQLPGTPGAYGWGGAASTTFWIDPQEDLIIIFMTQLRPSSAYPWSRALRTLTYAALLD